MSLDDAVQVLLNDEPLHRVTAGHHGTLRAERRKEVKTLGRVSLASHYQKTGIYLQSRNVQGDEKFLEDAPPGRRCSRTCGRPLGALGTGRRACVPAG